MFVSVVPAGKANLEFLAGLFKQDGEVSGGVRCSTPNGSSEFNFVDVAKFVGEFDRQAGKQATFADGGVAGGMGATSPATVFRVNVGAVIVSPHASATFTFEQTGELGCGATTVSMATLFELSEYSLIGVCVP